MYFKDRILYLDVLRALAIIFVVLWHMSNHFPTNIPNNYIIMPIRTLVKIAIPLFLMISGALLIRPKKYDILEFYKKRFSRIFIPYIFWVIIYFILGLTVISDHYGLINYDIPGTLSIQYFLGVFFSISEFSLLFYFIWLIVGVYLIIPILNSFVKDYGLKGIEYILMISLIGIVISTLGYDNTNLSDRLNLINVFFSGIFYPVLGYYLHHKSFKLSNKMLILVGLIFIYFRI